MLEDSENSRFEVFTSHAFHLQSPRRNILDHLIDVARWTDKNGFRGVYIPVGESHPDPWLVAQIVLQSSDTISPFVSLHADYMHPYAAAKVIASLSDLYGRRLFINTELSLSDKNQTGLPLPLQAHERYDQLVEFVTIVEMLLSCQSPITYLGRFYTIEKLRIEPIPNRTLMPGLFASGASAKGRALARALGVCSILHPEPTDEMHHFIDHDEAESCYHFGIVARETDDEAWEATYDIFPQARRTNPIRSLAMALTSVDAGFSPALSELDLGAEQPLYWWTQSHIDSPSCPWLVGSYQRVSREVARFISRGTRRFIIELGPDEADYRHASILFHEAVRLGLQ